ncbi:very long chain fatty acid elongase AAEL008004-like [Ornithodoros turicata]|uniref:very long chain fatty acid elongase AAEL008004-like n=1 Tax=Ornithodoros turicata TaxID=34597 RepID=UPI0031395172
MITATASQIFPTMSAYISDLIHLLQQHADPRTKDFPLIGNPTMVLTLIACYLYVVKIGGPRWMEDRKPYDLRKTIMVYNLVMVALNVFFFTKFLTHSYLGGGYSLLCQGIDFDDPKSIPIVTYCWWYFIVRILDFADTMFFLLRKKYSHISFLHVVHHSLVVWNGWLFITFGSDGQGILGVSINSFIHIVMYTYYFLSAFGPSVQKYLWWKKYITTMQILQFAVFIVFVCVPLFKDCGYPKILTYLAATQCFFFLVLFVNFYIHTYTRVKKGEVHFFCGNYEAGPAPAEGGAVLKNGVVKNNTLQNGLTHRKPLAH